MATPLITQLGTFSGAGTGSAVAARRGSHTFAASVRGAGAVSATVAVQGSNDLVGWVALGSLAPTGTTAAAAVLAVTASHRYWRAVVSALSAGATVVADVSTDETASGGDVVVVDLGAYTATGAGQVKEGRAGDHTVTASVSGAGAVSAAVSVQASNDLVGWATLGTIEPSGTTAAAAMLTVTSSHRYWRVNVTALSAGATVAVHAALDGGNAGAGGGSPGSVTGAGIPSAFTSRALTNADDGDTLICASAQTATVNTGLSSGFGCAFKGAISFTGSATVTDVRTTGAANPWCALVQTGTDTYDAVGGKA